MSVNPGHQEPPNVLDAIRSAREKAEEFHSFRRAAATLDLSPLTGLMGDELPAGAIAGFELLRMLAGRHAQLTNCAPFVAEQLRAPGG